MVRYGHSAELTAGGTNLRKPDCYCERDKVGLDEKAESRQRADRDDFDAASCDSFPVHRDGDEIWTDRSSEQVFALAEISGGDDERRQRCSEGEHEKSRGMAPREAAHQTARHGDRQAEKSREHQHMYLVEGQTRHRRESDGCLTDPRVHRHVFVNEIAVEMSSLTQHLRLSEEVGRVVIECREPPHDHGSDHDCQNRRNGDAVDRPGELIRPGTSDSWM
jgi:hypothetical protein